MNHSPGPWTYSGDDQDGYRIESGLVLIAEVRPTTPSYDRYAEDAARIVACVNHCEGFDTETIAVGPDMAELVADYTGGASRDLLSAARKVVALLDSVRGGTSGAGHYYADGKATLHAVTVPLPLLEALEAAIDHADGKDGASHA